MIKKFLPLLIPHILVWTFLSIWVIHPGLQSGWDSFGTLSYFLIPTITYPFMRSGYESSYDSSLLNIVLFVYVYFAYLGFIVYKSLRIYYELGNKSSKAWMLLAFIAFYPFAAVHLIFWISKLLKII